MNSILQIIPKTATGRRSGIPMKPSYITVHGTGNPKSTAQNEADNVCNNHPLEQTSFHFVVGEAIQIQTLPTNEVAWHAGDGSGKDKNGKDNPDLSPGNRKSIGIEMVETGDREKVLRNTLSLIVELMGLYQIPLEGVVAHHHWTDKNCPRILLDKNFIKDGMDWNWFRKELYKAWDKYVAEKAQSWAWAESIGLIVDQNKTDLVTYESLVNIIYKLQQGR